jgi:hypothetical protein
MKKQILYFASVALAAGLAACSSDELEGTSLNLKSGQLAAAIPEAVSTRVSIDGTKASWNREDADNEAIGVYNVDDNGKVVTSNYKYTLAETKTDKTDNSVSGYGVFEYTGKTTGTPKYAYYPYTDDAGVTFSNNAINITSLQAKYDWEEGVAKMPMVGTISGSTISFKNTTALLKISVVNMPAGKKFAKLTYAGKSSLTGKGSVDLDEGVLRLSDEVVGSKTIEIDCPSSLNGGAFETGKDYDFYFILPVNNYLGGLTFALGADENTDADVTDDSSNVYKKTYTNTLNAEVGYIYGHTLRYEKVSYELSSTNTEDYALQDTDLNDLNSDLEGGKTTLSADLTNSAGTVYLPNAASDITIDVTLGTGKITIQDADAEHPFTHALTLNLGAETVATSDLTINLTSADVKLVNPAAKTKATDDVTVNKVSVTTLGSAENTEKFLTVGNGVEVKTLAFSGNGNVFVEDGGSITTDATGTSGKSNFAFYEAEASPITQNNDSESNLPVLDKPTYDLFYPAGGTITLTNETDDYYKTLGKGVTIKEGVTVTIDLNGKELSTSATGAIVLNVSGTLNIEDSSSKGEGKITTAQSAAVISVGATGTVNLKGGAVTGGTGADAVIVNGGTLNITKGSITAGSGKNALNIKAGTASIDVPQTAPDSEEGDYTETLVVTGPVAVGATGKLELKSGKITGAVTATGEENKAAAAVDVQGGEIAPASGSALALVATAGPASAEISGGTISAADDVISLTGESTGKKLTLTVKGGKIATATAEKAAIVDATAGATIDIQGGEISGVKAGISLKFSSLTVSGESEAKISGTTNAILVTPQAAAATNNISLALTNPKATYTATTALNISGSTEYELKSASVAAGIFVGNVVSNNTYFISGGQYQKCEIMKAVSSWAKYVVDGKTVNFHDEYYWVE